jgi:hypothetical protein
VPEPKKMTVTVFKLTEGLGLIEIEVFEYTETCAVLGAYAARGANSKPMFRSHVSSFCLDFLTLEEIYGITTLLYMHAKSFIISGMTATFPCTY